MAYYAFVIGLYAIALGMTVGVLVSGLGLVRGVALRGESSMTLLLCVLFGWTMFQVAEDRVSAQAWRVDFAEAKRVASGVSAETILTEDDLPFYAEGADEALEAQVVEAVGFGGIGGRWLFRAEDGVRLIGGYGGGRTLALGVGGAVAYAIGEVGLAMLIALRVTAGARRRRDGPE